jgi:serine protease Do
MKLWKTVALSAAFAGAAGLGAAYAPVAHGQSSAPRAAAPRVAELFSRAGGSRIGVAITDIDAADVKGKTSSGVLVDSVDEDSPAAKAGIKKGDVLVEFDGERVRSVRQFTRLVSETPGGRTVAAGVMRDGSRLSVNITPREGNNFSFLTGDNWESFDSLRRFSPSTPPIPARPARPARPVTPPAPMPPSLESFIWRGGNRLGVTATELSPQLAEFFGAKDGVLVSAVEDGSAAAKAGVKAGDIVTSINGQKVESASDLRREMSQVDPGEEFTLTIVRDKKTMTVKGKGEGSSERRRTSRIIL